MADPMTRLTQATMDLKKNTKVFNYWTFIAIILLVALMLANVFIPWVFLEPWLNIVVGVNLFFIIIAFVSVLFIKDTQKQIMLNIIRALLGALLPLALVFATFGPVSLWLKILGGVLFCVGLLLFYLIFKPIYTMTQITKELVKSQKS